MRRGRRRDGAVHTWTAPMARSYRMDGEPQQLSILGVEVSPGESKTRSAIGDGGS